jgi:predicted nucleic acid-binding protein
MSSPPLVLLDACVIVNLYATRCLGEIVATVAGTVAIVDVVKRESQHVRRGGTGEDRNELDPINLEPLISARAIRVLTSDDDAELMTFIDLTRELDNGEAMTAAVAIHRGGIVVTDDQKAARLLRENGVPLQSTLALCKVWADTAAESQEVVRTALNAIRERGRYEPPRSHPLRTWWETMLLSQEP